MHRHIRMLGQEGLHGMRLVTAHVVADDVDFLALGLAAHHVGEERRARRSWPTAIVRLRCIVINSCRSASLTFIFPIHL